MDLNEAKSVLDINIALRAALQRASESLAVFGTIDQARGLTLDNHRQRLALLKDNLEIWAALMDAAAQATNTDVREAYNLLLEFHADQMRRYAAEI